MTDPRSLFRPEAIEAHARGHQPEPVIDVRKRPTRRWFALVVVVAVAAVVLAVSLHTTSTTSGPAVVDPRTSQVVARLPAAVAPRLAVGQAATGPGWSGRVVGIGPEVADSAGVRITVRLAASGAVATRPWPQHGRVTIVLGHPTIAVLLVPGLRGWLGG